MKKVIAVFRGGREIPVQKALEDLADQLKIRDGELSVEKFWADSSPNAPLVIIGKVDEPLISHIFAANSFCLPREAESLSIHSCFISENRKALVITGADTAALMYAIYELSDRIRCEGFGVLSEDIHLEEKPENALRGVDRYIMNHLDEEWFYSREFWEGFLKKMARNRFNRFTLITGFDTAYMTPPYPFFVEVPGFQKVRIKNFTPEKRKKNLEALRTIAALCGDYGIVFSFSSWQQKPWTGNQEDLMENMPGDDKSFTAYCAGGIKTLLEECPGIGALQFRVNHEAGITSSADKTTNTHENFWNAIIDAVASVGRPVKLDLRAKGVTDSMINYALSSGLDISIPTKYWCEHAALPYHISRLRAEESRNLKNMNSSRRYSYGDMLKKPHWYDMIYRLWNYGSINLFLWGDPDYCSRFSKSLRMGDGIGFEINSPLSLKGGMEAYARDPWCIHKDPDLRTYRWEDERYWAYYLVFGRYGYNSDTDRNVISREFRLRFGAEGEEILHAYESASKIMPFITTIHFPVHPSLHYWPELYSGAALFAENNYDPYFGKTNYASAMPSDEELFYSIAEYADDELAGTLKAKYSPLVLRDLLHGLALEIKAHLVKAGCGGDSKGEKLAMYVDFSMLALFADFHAWKSAAAYYLYRYKKSGKVEELQKSYTTMRNANSIWEELSGLGSRYYHDDLQFNAGTGTRRNKNWQARQETEIKSDLEKLEKLLAEAGEPPDSSGLNLSGEYFSIPAKSSLNLRGTVPEEWNKKEDLILSAALNCGEEPASVFLNYRHTDHTEGDYIRVPMRQNGKKYEASIPGEYFAQGFDVIVYFSALDKNGGAAIFPGIYNSEYPAPYFVIKSGMVK